VPVACLCWFWCACPKGIRQTPHRALLRESPRLYAQGTPSCCMLAGFFGGFVYCLRALPSRSGLLHNSCRTRTIGSMLFKKISALRGQRPASVPAKILLTVCLLLGGVPSTITSAAPTLPGQILITSIIPSSGKLTVAWEITGPGAALTGVQFTTNNGTNWLTTGSTSSPVVIESPSTSADANLVNGTTYAFALRAVNAAGNAPASKRYEIIVGDSRTQPANITAVAVDERKLTLTLLHPVRDTGKGCVQYSTDSGTTYSPLETYTTSLDVSSLSSDQTKPLVNGTSYGLRVRYWDVCGLSIDAALTNEGGFGISGPSAVIFATPSSVPSPSEITSVSPRATSLSVSAELGMNGGSAITRLEYSTDGGTSWAAILPIPAALSGKLDVPGTAYSFTIVTKSSGGSLSINTAYTVALRSMNVVGYSEASASVSASTTGAPQPSEISSVSAKSNSLTVNANLGSPGGSTITRLEYSTDGGTSWTAILPIPAALSGKLDVPGTAYSFTIVTKSSGGSLSADATYTVALRSVSGAGTSSASASVSASTTGVLYMAPPSIDTVTVRNKSFIVKSVLPTPPSGVSINSVEYSTNGGTNWRDSGQSTGNFVISVTSSGVALTVGALYSIVVRVVTSAGRGSASDVYEISAGNVSTPPIIQSVSSNNGLVTVTGVTGNTNGVPIMRLEYSTDNGVSWATGMTLADVTSTTTIPSATTTTVPSSSTSSTTTTTTISPSSTGIPKNWSFVFSSLSSSISTPVAPGQAYVVKVRSVSAAGVSGPSNAKTVTLSGTPKVPTIQTATATNNSITLSISYAKITGVVVSDIEYSTDDGVSWASYGDTGGTMVITEESTTVSRFLSPGKLYVVRIRLIANGGVSGTSAPISVRTKGTDPALTMEKIANKSLSSGSFDLKGEAKSKSGREVVYESETPTVCSVAKTVVTLRAEGECTIVASVASDGEFKEDKVSRSFTVTAAVLNSMAVDEKVSLADLGSSWLPAKAAKAAVTGQVVKSSRKVCTVTASQLSALKPGVCKVKLSSTNKAGKTVSKVVAITVK